MECRSLHRLLKQVRNGLSWPVIEQSHQMPVVRIVSYPRNRYHVIFRPSNRGKRSGARQYLHELGHATLCERVHPAFSASCSFAPQDNKRQFLILVPALNAACDWFVGGWQMEVAPQLTRQQFRESRAIAEEILREATLPPLEIILDAALVLAQTIHYLGEPVECEGVLQTAVKAFLDQPPDQPSAENCVTLVNTLMSTYTHLRARLVFYGGNWIWVVNAQAEPDSETAA